MTYNIRIHNLYWVMVFGCFPLIFYSFFVYGTIFGLFFSIALLTAFVGCDSDDVEDPVVPAVSKPDVAVSEHTPTSIGVEWDAVDEAAGYQ